MLRRLPLVLVAAVVGMLWTSPPVRAQQAVVAQADESDGEPAGDGLRFVVRTGATASVLRGQLDVSGPGPVELDVGYGFAAMAGIDVPLAARLSVQAEVGVVRRLTRLDLAGDAVRSKLSVNYVEVPLLLKWYPAGKSGSRLHLDAGAVPAFRLAASREVRQGDAILDIPSEGLLTERDLAVAVGLGLELSELFAHFTVDVRYLHGVSEANAAPVARAARWSSLQALVGVIF